MSSARCRGGCRRPGCRRSPPATCRHCSAPARPLRWWVSRRASVLPGCSPPAAVTGSTPTRSCSPPARPTSAPACSAASAWPAASPRRQPSATLADAARWPASAAAVLALVVIVAIAPVLSGLPRAVLSAIVVNAVWKLMDFAALRRYARVRRNDIVAAGVAAVGVLAFGPLYGLLLAVAGSVLGLVYRSSRVDVEVMGKVPHEKAAWGSTRNHEERPTFPGVLVLRVDAPSSGSPRRRSTTSSSPRSRPRRAPAWSCSTWRRPTRWTRRAPTRSPTCWAELRERDVDLYLVRVMWPVRQALRRSGLVTELGEDHLWHSISRACGRPGARTGSSSNPRRIPTPRTFPSRSSSTRKRRSTSLLAFPLPFPRAAPAWPDQNRSSPDRISGQRRP